MLCTARHLSVDPDDDTAVVVMIRYVDRYERRDGRWCIADRQIRFLWSERTGGGPAASDRLAQEATHDHVNGVGRPDR